MRAQKRGFYFFYTTSGHLCCFFAGKMQLSQKAAKNGEIEKKITKFLCVAPDNMPDLKEIIFSSDHKTYYAH